MPRLGNEAANTAAPQPPKVSQNVPKNSAVTRRLMSWFMCLPFQKWQERIVTSPASSKLVLSCKACIHDRFLPWNFLNAVAGTRNDKAASLCHCSRRGCSVPQTDVEWRLCDGFEASRSSPIVSIRLLGEHMFSCRHP